MSLRVGIDIGSTTVKVVVLDEQNKLLFRSYERHFSKTRERALETLNSISDMLSGQRVKVTITGSAGLGVANAAGIDFVQEVYATAAAVNTYIPDTDAVIELGGEDAKIIFFGGSLEERMNGSCAGGTGAFIDQMATLMNVTVNELDTLSLKHEKIYPIASRCGVFAKSDIPVSYTHLPYPVYPVGNRSSGDAPVPDWEQPALCRKAAPLPPPPGHS